MKGSPLLRTVLVLLSLVASGFLFASLTAEPETKAPEEAVERRANEPIKAIDARVHMTLSGVANTVQLFANAGYYRFGQSDTGIYTGELRIAEDNPVMEIKVDWGDDSPTRRFAKVVIEPEGRKTFTHVFDATGDIDDFVELPF